MESAKLPNHGSFGSHFTGVRSQIKALPIHGTFPSSGPQNRVRYWTGSPALGDAGFRKPKRLSSFGNQLHTEQFCFMKAGLTWAGLVWAGMGCPRLARAGLGWAELPWACLGWPALAWAGVGWH